MRSQANLSDDHRRDVELVLIGFVLGAGSPQSNRERVLAAMPPGSLLADNDKLLDAFRTNSGDILKAWLVTRGCVFEKGKDIPQAMLDLLYEMNTRASLIKMTRGLAAAGGLEDLDSFFRRIESSLEQILKLRNKT